MATAPERVAVFYRDGVRFCRTPLGWERLPDHGVQVVAAWPRTQPRRWTNVEDRDIWTGEDEYDPFGWGVKYGSLIDADEYERIWREAFYGDH